MFSNMYRTLNNLNVAGWLLSLFTVMLAVLVWGQDIAWDTSRLTAYKVFPLLGIAAFGLMWAHYIIAAIRQLTGISKQSIKVYFEATSLIVLFLILLHPGLLIIQLWRDGFGLPPESYLENYVAPSLKWAAMLGVISLVVFIAFELRHWFDKKNWWPIVSYASDAAMAAILVHGFKLGSHIQGGWFKYVWFFYAATLAICLMIKYSNLSFNSVPGGDK